MTVDEVKTHLRIEDDDEDDYLAGLIAQAQAVAEDFCRAEFEDSAPEPVRLAVMLMVSHYYPVDRLMHDIALALMAVQTQTTEVLDEFPTKAAKTEEAKAETA